MRSEIAAIFLGQRSTIWLIASTVADLLIMSMLAIRGITMGPVAGLDDRL